MRTYADYLKVKDRPEQLMYFVRAVISEHSASDLYDTASVGKDYDRKLNRTINQYQKLLYTLSGRTVPDNYSANYKMPSAFFHRFVTQEVQYLLGNGVTWQEDTTADKLGEDFDARLQEAARIAITQGEAFGFYNLDHLEVFELLEFAPIYDESNGALMAGVRFWQIDSSKPLRATLYDVDGYTDYLWDKDGGRVLKEKRPYVSKVRFSEADGTEIYDFENYEKLPIVPLWSNSYKQSEIIGLREQIDAYDLIKSGFANDLDDASQIYWTIQNAGGMDDVDLARFVERMKTVKAAVIDDNGARAEAHTLEVPYASRTALLDRISRDLYRDAMALDTDNIVGGAITATQIMAAYEPLNLKCDELEYCLLDFLQSVLKIAGIEGENPTFTRSVIVNKAEEVQMTLQSAQYLTEEYVTRKLLTILGDGDKADDILDDVDKENMERLASNENIAADIEQAIEEVENGENEAAELDNGE